MRSIFHLPNRCNEVPIELKTLFCIPYCWANCVWFSRKDFWITWGLPLKTLNPIYWKCETFRYCTKLLNLAIVCVWFWMLSLYKEHILFIWKRGSNEIKVLLSYLYIAYINVKALLYLPNSSSKPRLNTSKSGDFAICKLYKIIKNT